MDEKRPYPVVDAPVFRHDGPCKIMDAAGCLRVAQSWIADFIKGLGEPVHIVDLFRFLRGVDVAASAVPMGGNDGNRFGPAIVRDDPFA